MIPHLGFGGPLADRNGLAEALVAAGLQGPQSRNKADLLARAEALLLERVGNDLERPCAAFLVPGRIEVLGKHTDYAGGSSLVAASEQGFVVACVPREDRVVRVTDLCRNETIEFSFDADISPVVGEWSNYPMTVARRMARNFPRAERGAEIVFGSDLPSASGMSSSSAMIVGFFLALAEANRTWELPEFQLNVRNSVELASYLATNENGQSFGPLEGDRGVGTAGGSEDHTAILCCRAGTLSQYAYCPARHVRDLPMPEEHAFVIGSSGVVAEKTGSAMAAYNRASHLARVAATTWCQATGRNEPHLAAIVEYGNRDTAEVRRRLETASLAAEDVGRDEVLRRFDHFCVENLQVLPKAVEALSSGDADVFGEVTDRSQQAAEALLGNQIPETKFLARSARRLGAVAASAFGAGFGGSVWALVKRSDASDFEASWREAYCEAFSPHARKARFFVTKAAPCAMRIA